MPKLLTMLAMVISILVALVFGLDLGIKIPFGRVSVLMDVGFVVSGLLLGVLSWTTFREQ